MKVGILGRTKMLYDTALKLRDANHEIAFIGTCKASPESKVNEEDFRRLAEKLGIPFFNSLNLNEHSEMMASSGAEICVSMNWLSIIGQKITDIFKHGILNAHGGDLPRYRGNACFNWALLNGENRVCMTIHKMESGKLDSGDILLKKYKDVSIKTTIGELYDWIHECVPEMYLEVVNKFSLNQIVPVSQMSLNMPPLRCYPRSPEDSRIDWNLDAAYIERLVNASSEPFAGAFTFFKGDKITVWKGYSSGLAEESLYINGQVLSVDKVSGEVHVGARNGIFSVTEISAPNYEGRVKPAQIIKSLRDRFTTLKSI